MGMSLRIRLYQAGILAPAVLLAALFLHWFITQPVPISPGKDELGLWAMALFYVQTPFQWPAYAHYLTLILGLLALNGLVACALASVLALRVPDQISARRLAWALVCTSFAIGYIFFVTSHTEYRALIGWSPSSPVRLAFDCLAYAAGALAPLNFVRFFLSYPRTLRPDEWTEEALRQTARECESLSSTGWRRWLFPSRLRTRMVKDLAASAAKNAERQVRFIRIAQTPTPVYVLCGWAFLCALLDWLAAAHPTILGGIGDFSRVVLCLFLLMFLPIYAGGTIFRNLQIYSTSAAPEDRRKIDWIKSTLFVGFIFLICMVYGGGAIGIAIMSRDVFIPPQLLLFGPLVAAALLLLLALIISLALSIFYRGAIDPRLAARRITVFGVLGLGVAFLFVLIERTVALKIVAYFNLAPDTGALIAGACVAATIAPIKNHTERGITTFVGRFLPLDSMIEGEKKTLVVALSDLSGYTSLSSRDEKQAMLLAALLQRQANKLVDALGGRVVKSMGDAVMFAFDDAHTAAKVLLALHREFAPAAEQLGITPLLVHSGAYMGEVTIAHGGDLYGQTVNIAARIQGAAEPGQIVVSDAIAAAAGGAACRDLGPRQFKNVPQAIACHELLTSLPSPPPAVG